MNSDYVLGFKRLILPNDNCEWDKKFNLISQRLLDSHEEYVVPINFAELYSSFIVLKGGTIGFFPSFVGVEEVKNSHSVVFSTLGNNQMIELPEAYDYDSLIVAPLNIKEVLEEKIKGVSWISSSLGNGFKKLYVGRLKSI